MRLAAALCPDQLYVGAIDDLLPDRLAVIRGREGGEGKKWVGNREGRMGRVGKADEGLELDICPGDPECIVMPQSACRRRVVPKDKKVKFSHTRYRALGPELIPVYRQSARR